jgi:hypothetical protein
MHHLGVERESSRGRPVSRATRTGRRKAYPIDILHVRLCLLADTKRDEGCGKNEDEASDVGWDGVHFRNWEWGTSFMENIAVNVKRNWNQKW